MMNKWTTEYPKEPGYYWLRNCAISTWRGDVTTPDLTVVKVDSEGDFRGIDSEETTFKHWVVSAEWCGPIRPPENL